MDKLGFNLVGFVGVVEDRQDPEQLGRVRVRCFGYHTETLCDDTDDSGESGGGPKNCVDTAQLPWAVPIAPNTHGAMNGIGHSSVGLVEGTWVFGVFLDGDAAQQPMIMGAIPGMPECVNPKGDPDIEPDECTELSTQVEGFYDPRKADDGALDDVPRPAKLINYKKPCADNESENASKSEKNSFTGYKEQSHNPAQKEQEDDEDLKKGVGELGVCIEENDRGENYPIEGEFDYETRKGTFQLEPDTNRLAQSKDDEGEEEEKQDKTLLKWKRDNLDKDVPTAEMPDITAQIPEKCEFRVGPNLPRYREESCDNKVKSLGTKWEEPETPYDAKYPYNRVMETESGHIEEWDDTPGAERYHRFHRAGTFTEIHPDGTKVEKIVGERYTIILTNDKIHIEANSDITIDKAAKIYVNADNQPGNHFDIQIGRNSDLNINALGGINLRTGTDLNIATAKDLTFDVGGDVIWRVKGDVDQHITGNTDTTIMGNSDLAITGSLTELISGSDGFIQEIQSGSYTQQIATNSLVICGGVMTEVGTDYITMNPIGGPSLSFTIDPTPDCIPVPNC